MKSGNYHVPENSTYVVSGSVPDGFTGLRADCVFHLKDGKVFACHKYGFHSVGLYHVSGTSEAKRLLNYHADNWNYVIH